MVQRNGQHGNGTAVLVIPRETSILPLSKKQLTVDPELRMLGAPLAAAERANLEARLRADGRCLEPLIVWKGQDIILDGHHRHDLCQKHGLPFEYVEIDLPDRDAARAWIVEHQLDKRNLQGVGLSHLRGLRYRQAKGPRGGNGANQHTTEQLCNDCTIAPGTAERLAKELRVSTRTIYLDAKLVGWIDEISERAGLDAKQLVLSPDSRCKHKDVKWLASVPKARLSVYVDKVRTGERFQATWRKEDNECGARMTVPREPHALAGTLLKKLGMDDLRLVRRNLDDLVKMDPPTVVKSVG